MSSMQCAKCSKEDDETLQRCSRCKNTIYCLITAISRLPTSRLEVAQAFVCARSPRGSVRGMILGCESDITNYTFNEVDLDAAHPIHTQGIVCPVSAQVGLPLVIYRHLRADPSSMDRDPGLDNQRATFLMIDPESGFAPPEWQMCVGSVTVMRQDGKPLTRQSIETIWMYHNRLLDLFGDGATPRRMMTREGFINYCRNYKEDQLTNRRTVFREMPVPL